MVCLDLQAYLHPVLRCRFPDNPPIDPVEQFHQAHFSNYSTLWHYGMYEVPADMYPSFIVGRNPYTRLLSGFLNEMVREGQRGDDWTMKVRADLFWSLSCVLSRRVVR